MTEQNLQQETQSNQTSAEHPEISEHEWIDDCFRVYKTRFKIWHSASKDGKELITALSKDVCIQMTRFYLKGRQEGWPESNSRVLNSGVVGGKL
jgi:hypothetical protein